MVEAHRENQKPYVLRQHGAHGRQLLTEAKGHHRAAIPVEKGVVHQLAGRLRAHPKTEHRPTQGQVRQGARKQRYGSAQDPGQSHARHTQICQRYPQQRRQRHLLGRKGKKEQQTAEPWFFREKLRTHDAEQQTQYFVATLDVGHDLHVHRVRRKKQHHRQGRQLW